MAEELGLADPPLPWHTERLRIIDVAAALARVTAALSKIARDVTLLAQTEVGEVSEGGGDPGPRDGSAPRRGGSSAMPQQEQPGRRDRHPRLRAGRRPACWPPCVASAEQELPARRRRLARRMAAVRPPARARRLRRRLGARPAGGPDRRHRADGRQPRRGRGPAAGRAGHRAAARRARRRPGARPGGDRGRAGGQPGVPLRDVLLATPEVEDKLAQAGITPAQIERALEPGRLPRRVRRLHRPPPWPPTRRSRPDSASGAPRPSEAEGMTNER